MLNPILARLRPVWEQEARGTVWLGAGVATMFVLGLVLQLLALRSLSGGDYATFVFGLGIGNVASAVAAAIQPVVAVRAGTRNPFFLPAPPGPLLGATISISAFAALLVAPVLDPLVALLALLQVPLHAAVGVGFGRLQSAKAFPRIAAGLALQSTVRVAVVLPWVLIGRASATVFVLALSSALLAVLLLLIAVGAYRGIEWSVAPDGRQLLTGYALWGLFAWLINADAVLARITLAPVDADRYALALTLGRQVLYAVAPLTTVLLPVTLSAHPRDNRARLWALLLVSGLLLVASLLVLGVRPEMVARLLTGEVRSGDGVLIRGYAVVGALAAAATLLVTFTFALGRPPRLWVLAILGAGAGLTVTLVIDEPSQLLLLQGALVATIVAVGLILGLRATTALNSGHIGEF